MNNLAFGSKIGAPRDARPTICTGCEAVIRKGSPGAPPTYAECDRCRAGRVNDRIVERIKTNRIFNPTNKYREKRSRK